MIYVINYLVIRLTTCILEQNTQLIQTMSADSFTLIMSIDLTGDMSLWQVKLSVITMFERRFQ